MRKIIVIGGVAGGASAAARLRRLNEDDHIILLERGEFISFANCGLPYHISGVIPNRSDLIVETVENMSENFNLDIRNLSEVIKIDRDKKEVVIKNVLTNNTYRESYDKLVISTGANPLVPKFKGLDKADNIFTLRNIPDMDDIMNHIETKNVKRAVVVGGGFIGLEVMENLKLKGLDVTLVELGNQVMQSFDYELSQLIHKQMISKGVKLVLSDGVNEFLDKGRKIKLTSGIIIESDLTILAIGVRPDNVLAIDANLELTDKGYINVDNNFLTNDKDIYAIGDVVEINNLITNTKMPIALAGPANKQGRFVANHINGIKDDFKGSIGTSATKVFDLVIASTGLNESMLHALGKSYESLIIHPNNHATYYPDATPITIKALFNKESRKIYGAQAVGFDGVDKRIDVIATAIQAGLSVTDLKDLELAYAPPFSNAKDPVNMIGFVAENMINGLIEFVSLDDFQEAYLNHQDVVFLDIRNRDEFRIQGLPKSTNIPLNELRDRHVELDKDKDIYIYCQVGQRSYNAARVLMEKGYQAKVLKGGLKAYNCLYDESGTEICFSTNLDSGVWNY